MKRHKNKVRSRANRKSRKQNLSVERLDDRVMLDAAGLVITSPSAISVRAGQADVTVVTADDPVVTFSISGGVDAGQFDINANTGALTFDTVPDHGNPTDVGGDNVYDVIVQAQDNFSNSADGPMAVTVLPPNVSPQVAAGTFSVVENQTAIGTVAATDANTLDAGGDTLTFSFTNASDASVFKLNAATGELSFVIPPDFESGNVSFSVDITVTDALGLADTATQSITITDADEPVVSSGGNVVLSSGQSASNSGAWSHPTAGAVTLYSTSGVVVQDGNGTWDWTGDAVSGPLDVRLVTITAIDDVGQVATTTFSVSLQNTAPLLELDNSSVTVSEADLATNTGTFGDLDGHSVLLSSSIGSIVDQADGSWSWSYASSGAPTESQYVGIIATDSSGSARATAFQLVVENVAPTISVDQPTVAADEGTTTSNSGSFGDVGGDVVTVTADAGSVTTNADGTWDWSYLAPDGTATETITLTAIDSDGAQSTVAFSLEIANVAPSVAADVAAVSVNEGGTATVTGTMSDQAVPADGINLSSSIGTMTAGNGTWQWMYDSSDGPDESGIVTITATDSDGGVSTTTFDLTVDNLAPTITADSASVTVVEGDTAVNNGSFSDAGLDDVTLTASFGTVVDNSNGAWIWSYGTLDGPDESGTVTITATDSDGAQATVQFGLTVDNVAPTIAVNGAPATVTVVEGDMASISGTYSELGPSDAVTIVASVGTIIDNGNDTWFWSLDTTDGTDESQTVTLTITDSEGADGTATFDLVVDNAAPVIAVLNATVTADEGTTTSNTITVTDAGDDSVQSLSTSIGTVSDNGDGTWAWSYLAPNGPASETVTVTATDSDGATTTFDFALQITDVAPVVAADSATVTINEGETATVTGTMSDQAVPADSISLSSSLDGSGATMTAGNGTWQWSFLAADGDGTPQTVTISAVDADSSAADTTFELVVNNLPAVVTVVDATVTVDEGQLATNTGTFNDPGLDSVALSASFGTVLDDGNGDWSWSHPTTNGPAESQVVVITATDSDGAESTAEFSLMVDNVAPTIAVDNASVTVTEGSTANNSGSFGDLGDDTLTLSADRGTVVDNGNGTWNWSLDTVDGPDDTGIVTVTATDADGAATDVTFTLTVDNSSPSIAADLASVTVNESVTATMTGTHADLGDDVVQLTSTVGTILDNGDGTWSWSFVSTDGPGDSQTVTVRAEDDDGWASVTTFNLVVQNVGPAVGADAGAVVVSEGSTATNTGVFSDVGDDTVSLTSDLGTITGNGDGTWSWSWDATDGPEDSQFVTITATDADGAQAQTTFELVVNNAPGVLSVGNATVTVDESDTATNSGTVTDPGDDGATLAASVGTVTLLPDGTTWNWSFDTSDGVDDSQIVTITSTDDDGAETTITFDLLVNNLPAVVAADTADVIVSEGATAMNTGSYADPGADTITLAASIGTIQDLGAGDWSWSFPTTDGATESQQVTVTATDSDGADRRRPSSCRCKTSTRRSVSITPLLLRARAPWRATRERSETLATTRSRSLRPLAASLRTRNRGRGSGHSKRTTERMIHKRSQLQPRMRMAAV